jgi:hypothetical protein
MPCGPMLLHLFPLINCGPELAEWISSRTTVLIVLGSHAAATLSAIKMLLP